jgi:predicted dehydrogenase
MIRLGILGGLESGHARSYARAAGRNVALSAFWGDDPGAAAQFAREHGITLSVASPQQMLDDRLVDAVLVLQRDPEQHRALAIPFLHAGIPVYVDKPMATTLEDASAMFAAAAVTGTPLLSCSALRFSAEVLALRAPERGELRTVVATGYRDTLYYGIHAVEAVYTLLGPGVTSLHVMRHHSRDIIGLCYPDGRMGLVLLLRDSAPVLSVSAFGATENSRADIPDIEDHPMFGATLQAIVEMATTRRSPVNPAETLELLSALLAATSAPGSIAISLPPPPSMSTRPGQS